MVLNTLFIPKGDSYYQWARAPYFERKNSADVVFLGSSHIEWGTSPNDLWHAYGIPSFNYAIPGLDLKNSYFMLRELIKYQRPKVIVVDVFRIQNVGDQIAVTNRISNVFRPSSNRLEMINSNEMLNSLSARLDYYFPLHLYHARKLEPKDVYPKYVNKERGHVYSFERLNRDHEFRDINDTVKLSDENIAIIQRLMLFSEENKIPIVFIKTPNLKASEANIKTWNAIETIVQRNGFHFINFNKENVFKEAGLVYSEDIANDSEENGHLNHLGAEKISLYLGKFLIKNYNLLDRRKDNQYTYLDSCSQIYSKVVERQNPLKRSLRNMLSSTNALGINEYLISANGLYKLVLQGDGNLVLYKNETTPLWASNTPAKNIVKCEMQGDGNLVLYDKEEHPYWDTKTVNNFKAYLILQDDGNLVIYNEKGDIPLWSSGTVGM
jgi:hypothetical protein